MYYLFDYIDDACTSKSDRWTKPSYAKLQHGLYTQQWRIIDYPDNTRPLSRDVTNRVLTSGELKRLLDAFDSLSPPHIVPWEGMFRIHASTMGSDSCAS